MQRHAVADPASDSLKAFTRSTPATARTKLAIAVGGLAPLLLLQAP